MTMGKVTKEESVELESKLRVESKVVFDESKEIPLMCKRRAKFKAKGAKEATFDTIS